MNIRKAEEKDVDALYELLRQVQALHADGRPDIFKAGTNKYDRAHIRAIMSNLNSPVYVLADQNDFAVGYAFCDIKEEKGSENLRELKTFYIDDLCVAENLRGKGYGRMLYEYVRKVAKEIGCYHLTLNVWHLNKAAVGFYEKLGMKPLKTTMETVL